MASIVIGPGSGSSRIPSSAKSVILMPSDLARIVPATHRLLLREAMECSEPPDEVNRVDADDFAAGKFSGDDIESDAVARIVERRHDHDPFAT